MIADVAGPTHAQYEQHNRADGGSGARGDGHGHHLALAAADARCFAIRRSGGGPARVPSVHPLEGLAKLRVLPRR